MQPMHGVKGHQNEYPVPGSIAGPPCPGGYKYSGPILQVGGWVAGRQPVTVKKLVGNVNCGVGIVRLSGIDLNSGKGLVEL